MKQCCIYLRKYIANNLLWRFAYAKHVNLKNGKVWVGKQYSVICSPNHSIFIFHFIPDLKIYIRCFIEKKRICFVLHCTYILCVDSICVWYMLEFIWWGVVCTHMHGLMLHSHILHITCKMFWQKIYYSIFSSANILLFLCNFLPYLNNIT